MAVCIHFLYEPLAHFFRDGIFVFTTSCMGRLGETSFVLVIFYLVFFCRLGLDI